MIIEEETSYPQWETNEHGWHAVVTHNITSNQWTAYIEYADAPFWRIWAGCMFERLRQGQEWCRAEIAHQMSKGNLAPPPLKEEPAEPPAWRWLWETLENEVGLSRTNEIRAEMLQRLSEAEEVVNS